MQLGLRTRLLAWLVLVALPVATAGAFAVRSIEHHLSTQVESELAAAAHFELSRIDQKLDDYVSNASALAADPQLRDFLSDLRAYDAGILPRSAVIGGVNGYRIVDPTAEFPLTEVASSLQITARTVGPEILELQIHGVDGRVYGQTSDYTWQPADGQLFAATRQSRDVQFGPAFEGPSGGARISLAAPISNTTGTVIGFLSAEVDLEPIVTLVTGQEEFGATRESHIAQRTPEGDAQFITLLRFDRDAAFSLIVPAEENAPINVALNSPGTTILTADDYRDVESVFALQSIERTGWGLVVKLDRSEVFAPVAVAKRIVTVGALATLVMLLGGWVFLLQPTSRRLRRAVRSANKVAVGSSHQPIGDKTNDEIGAIARSIDRFATDLATDSKSRSDVEAKLRHQANHDDLTGLFNRKHATTVIRELFSDEHRQERSSVLFIDLDGFKNVNDTYGHPVGDEVLLAVANRLLATTDDGAIVARWGGDEFVVILPDTSADGAKAVTERVQSLFDDPVTTSAGHHQIGCSIGASTWASGRTVDNCLHEADQDMFAQKQARSGKRSVAPATVRAVEQALEDNRLEVHYQPLITIVDGQHRLIGAEALVRLRETNGDRLLPARFLEEVEDSPLGVALDRRVMQLGLARLADWVDFGVVDDGFKLAINAGGGTLRDAEFAAALLQETGRLGLRAEAVVIEISERVKNFAPGLIDALRAAGVVIAIDDVGLQYSNLDRLHDVRADVAKIDRRWLGPAGEPLADESAAVLRQLVAICRTLDMRIVAEGVETDAQLAALQELGVRRFQGYHFGRPVPADEFVLRWGQSAPAAEHQTT